MTDVGAALQLGDLAANRFAAVNRHAGDARPMSELVELLADLHGQLARGHQHQRTGRRVFAALLEQLDNRNGERGRLAGAGAGLAQHIDALQRVRNDSRLHRRWLQVAGPLQRLRASHRRDPIGESRPRRRQVGHFACRSRRMSRNASDRKHGRKATNAEYLRDGRRDKASDDAAVRTQLPMNRGCATLTMPKKQTGWPGV